MTSTDQDKWAIYLLIKCDDSYVPNAAAMIKELLLLKISDLVSFFLCVRLNRKNYKKFIIGDSQNMNSNDPSPENTTIFFKLERAAMGLSGNNRLVNVEEHPNFDFTDPADLTGFFKRFSDLNDNSCRNILMTWDHGRGYGMFHDDDGKKLTWLTMDEFNLAIQKGFGTKKFEMILIMNCYMLVIDTAYALRNSTYYLIASQYAMIFSGYNYTAIFQTICDDPEIESRKLAIKAITSFKDKKFSTKAQRDSIMGRTEIFLLDLESFDTMIPYFKALVVQLSESDVYRDKMTAVAMKSLLISDYYHLIDFFSLIQNLSQEKDTEIGVYLDSILNMKEEITPKNFIGDTFTLKGGQKIEPPSGISILFPANIKYSELHMYESYHFTESLFAIDTKWTELLKQVMIT